MFASKKLFIYLVIKASMKPRSPPSQSIRLLDRVRERIRCLHYCLSIACALKKGYLYWVRFFIRWHGCDGTMTHPRAMGALQAEAFLTMLAMERRV